MKKRTPRLYLKKNRLGKKSLHIQLSIPSGKNKRHLIQIPIRTTEKITHKLLNHIFDTFMKNVRIKSAHPLALKRLTKRREKQNKLAQSHPLAIKTQNPIFEGSAGILSTLTDLGIAEKKTEPNLPVPSKPLPKWIVQNLPITPLAAAPQPVKQMLPALPPPPLAPPLAPSPKKQQTNMPSPPPTPPLVEEPEEDEELLVVTPNKQTIVGSITRKEAQKMQQASRDLKLKTAKEKFTNAMTVATKRAIFNAIGVPARKSTIGKGTVDKSLSELISELETNFKGIFEDFLLRSTPENPRSFIDFFNKKKGKGSAQQIVDLRRLRRGRGLLYSDEIVKIMQPYEKSGFLGVIARDQIDELTKKLKQKLKNGSLSYSDRISWVMNLDPHTMEGSHWVAVFIDPAIDRSLEYYDSFGEPPPRNFDKDILQIISVLKPDTYLKYKINEQKQQSVSSKNCGWYVIKFLSDRYNGVTFKKATHYQPIKEQERNIMKFKKKFVLI